MKVLLALLTILISSEFFCTRTLAQEPGAQLAKAGYHQDDLLYEGSHSLTLEASSCSMLQGTNITPVVAATTEFWKTAQVLGLKADHEVLEQKRKALIEYAAGFAHQYAEDRAHVKDDKKQGYAAVDQVDEVFRKIAGGSDQKDWCVKFATVLSTLVDQDFEKDGILVSKTLLHGKSNDPFRADDIGSALKLLAVFDPKFPLSSVDWCNGRRPCAAPEKKLGAFIPASQPPAAGCLAVFYDDVSHKGHVGFVLERKGDRLTTIEGNATSEDGSGTDSGIVERHDRTWGETSAIRTKKYRGCILPWPGLTAHSKINSCPNPWSDSSPITYIKPDDNIHSSPSAQIGTPSTSGGGK